MLYDILGMKSSVSVMIYAWLTITIIRKVYFFFFYPIRKVYLVGRRGPVQAACTAKELREILGSSSDFLFYRI